MCHAFSRCLLVVLACVLVPGSRADLDSGVKRRPARIDCLRYVFAPQCRGVSAKRGYVQISHINDLIPEPESLDNVILKSFGSTFRNQDSGRNWQPLDSLLFPSLQYDLRPHNPRRRQANLLDDQITRDNVVFP